jgi:hypothetical protein
MKREVTSYAALGANFNENNDCVVRAFSLALNKPYDEVHAICAKHGRKPNRGCLAGVQRDVAKHYGMQGIMLDIGNLGKREGIYPTLAMFLRRFPKGHFYVARRGHAFTIIDGVVHDWARGTGHRSRIIRAFQAPEV